MTYIQIFDKMYPIPPGNPSQVPVPSDIVKQITVAISQAAKDVFAEVANNDPTITQRRRAWAGSALQGPRAHTERIIPAVLMDPTIQAELGANGNSSVPDATVQGVVNNNINLLINYHS